MNILHIINNDSQLECMKRFTPYMTEQFAHRFAYSNKEDIQTDAVDIIHAHSWFGAGERAFKLASDKHTAYIVSITQQDLDMFKRTLFFKKNSCLSILSKASKVVLTNMSQQNRLAELIQGSVANDIFGHTVTIIEPVDSFWTDNVQSHPPTGLVHIKLLYVGDLTDDSHLDTLFDVVLKLRRKNYDIRVTVVEDNVVECGFRSKLCRRAKNNECFSIQAVGTKQELLNSYRNHDIAVFLNEKSGSIARHVEALTQGLPVVYAKNGAFEGALDHKFTKFCVNPKNIDEISRTILLISESFATVEQHIMDLQPFVQFDAKAAASHYEHLYDNVKLKITD